MPRSSRPRLERSGLGDPWRPPPRSHPFRIVLVLPLREFRESFPAYSLRITPGDGPVVTQALLENTDLSARQIVEKSMKIAAEICIYTNENITVEEL